jgi:hypothetical protein
MSVEQLAGAFDTEPPKELEDRFAHFVPESTTKMLLGYVELFRQIARRQRIGEMKSHLLLGTVRKRKRRTRCRSEQFLFFQAAGNMISKKSKHQ